MLNRPPFPSGWASLALSPSNLTLANTLPVGQSFLWHRHAVSGAGPSDPVEEYSRAIKGRPPKVVLLRQSPTHLHYVAVHPDGTLEEADRTRKWLSDYFRLDSHPRLDDLYADWRRKDPGLFGRTELDRRAIGVRVLRQDPWECLLAFITSTNNHIPRISSLMHKLSRHYSEPCLELQSPDGTSTIYHTFPEPNRLPIDMEMTLRKLGFGYRAGFIESSLASLRAHFGTGPEDISHGLESWRTADLEQVREQLVALKGVGRKVADCVLLMCLDRLSVIPIDTHVAAIAARHPAFPSKLRNKPMSKQLYDDIQSFLVDKWGPLGGWCQAVMFAADLPPTISTPKSQKVWAEDWTPDRTSVLSDTSPSSTKSNVNGGFKRSLPETTTPELKRTRSASRASLNRTDSTKSLITGLETKVVVEEGPPR